MLLVGALLFARSLQSLARVDTGFNPQNVLLVYLHVSPATPDGVDRVRLFGRVSERFATIPGVRSIAMSSESLLSGNTWTESVNVRGMPFQRGMDRESVFLVVSPGFFGTMAIPITRGRDFTAEDDEKAPKVAVVNEAMAHFYFGEADPLGRTFQVENSSFPLPLTVVGLVQNSKYRSLKEPSPRIIYLPALQTPGALEGANFEIRTVGNPPRMADLLWNVARSESPYLRFGGFGTQERLVDATIAQDRMLAELFWLHWVIGSNPSVLGLIRTHRLSYRSPYRRDRSAYGSWRTPPRCGLHDPQELDVASVGRRSRWNCCDAAIDAVGDEPFVRRAPSRRLTLLATPVILVAIGAAATYLPARRATKVDPMVALRYE